MPTPPVTDAFLGHQSLLGVVAEATYGTTPTPGTIAALTNAYVFVSETIAKRGKIVERDGLRGTRSHVSDDTRTGPYTVSGTLLLEPSPVDLGFWLAHILGAAPVGSSYTLAETIPSFTLGVQRGPKKFRYAGCKVNRARFTGQQGGLLRLELEIVGQSENLETTSWPVISADTTGPYIFSDLTFTVSSTTREVRQFELLVDNGLVTDRFMNNVVIQNAPEDDRAVKLKTTHAWATANADLYDPALGGFGGVTLSLTSGSHTTTATFGALQVAATSPTTAHRQENYLTLDWVARKTGSTPELAFTHS